MKWEAFETTVPGKWVLAGEHAVLRGATAIAMPHPEFALKLRFLPGGQGLRAPAVVRELIQALADDRQEEGRRFFWPDGEVQVESTIPTGAGLGSSAALCAAVIQWVAEPLEIARARFLEVATFLEDRFHGKSSGMDVAAVLAAKPIAFVRARGPEVLPLKRMPRFSFHDTGIRARTSDCIIQVEELRARAPHQAMALDEKMMAAARGALDGLFAFDRGETAAGLGRVAESMRRAQSCFDDWSLTPREASRIIDERMAAGALACKLTGAGGGGFVVALEPG